MIAFPPWRDPYLHRRPGVLFAIFAACAGVLSTLRAAMGHLIMPSMVPWNADVVIEPIHWALWIMLGLIVGRVIRRFPLDRLQVNRALAAHALTAVALAPGVSAGVGYVRYELTKVINMTPVRAARMRWNPMIAIPVGVVDALTEYAALTGLCYVFILYGNMSDRRREAAELQQNLVTARLRALQAQLHPHFLFNVLHSTAMLAPHDGLAARNTLVALSDLLRRTLNATGKTFVPLSEEIDFLDRYLALEQHRFADRLQIVFDVDDDALHAVVPHLILQPLVENAVRHGVSRITSAGIIKIGAHTERTRLRISIEDNGPGLPPNWNESALEGIGITNVRQRLEHLYGSDYRFDFMAALGGGTVVMLELPYVIAAPATAAA